MRVAAAQMNSWTRDSERNVSRAVELIHTAAEAGADLVVLPEFFNVEYFPQHRDYAYLEYAESLDGPSLSAISTACADQRVGAVATIFERSRPGIYYDTAVLFGRDGVQLGAYRKTHPAAVYSLEKIYFRFGSKFPTFVFDGWRIGLMICYDAFFPEAARSLALNGAQLIIAPFAAPRHPVWRELHIARAFENGCFLVVCNKVGKEDGWDFSGQSLIVSPGGEVLAAAADDRDEVISAEIDQCDVDQWRQRYPMFRDRRPDLYSSLVQATEDL
jgi:N-carbamoylputrescine amidase